MSSVKLGRSHQTLRPLLDRYLGTDPDSSPRTHALRDPLSPGFPCRTNSSNRGWVPPQLRSFPVAERSCNNHVSSRGSPPTRIQRTPRHVEVTPRKSEGIEPFTLVNSPPGQVEDASSHMVNSPPCQVGVYPRKSEGIEPSPWSTLHQVSRGPVLDPINTPSGQVEDASSHTVNSPPCQVGVYPCKSEGIEPLTW